ncbi:cysteine hydrolase family protein [Paraburkholderia humisilvae]|uniref:Streptothricin hydrolase n=1 Tax=Paraburkholderia humisilvae TaxID=627669 RepID=A0A6J5E778_9BURK|nr:isochorismatase family protein [Paraburkholderia humisilvae]CAB3762203.1 Streptothricin hydrolase [Paraburkholderia humisilvae]
MQHPTIRTLAGATAPQAIDPAKTALLVIDFQNEYFDGKLPIPDGKQALANTRRLIERADADGIAVFHVQHVTPAGSPIFAEDSATSQIHADIQPAAHHQLVQKTSVSVFPTTDLNERLRKKGIDTLIIAGLMTHACVAGAARDAAPLGYNVIVADDACATRDLDLGDHDTVTNKALHRAALVSIADTFGDVMTTDALLSLSSKTR